MATTSIRVGVFAFASVLSSVAFAAIPNSSAYVQRGLVMHWDAIDNAGVRAA